MIFEECLVAFYIPAIPTAIAIAEGRLLGIMA
jgi:hypothetical protein